MRAEIVAIGTELTTGAKLDTNSQWLSLQLAAVGIPVDFHIAVDDDLRNIVGVLQTSIERSDIIVITGGLGPTLDDLTRQAIAVLLDSELVLDDASLAHIRQLFQRFKRPMPERNLVQAMFPRNSLPIFNALGTAPGIWSEVPRGGDRSSCIVAALPGVPSEMKPMFLNEVLPRLASSGSVIRFATVHTFGQGESAVEERLGELTARGRDPEVGITAHEGTITLRIAACAETIEQCDQKIAAAVTNIHSLLGDLVYGTGDIELEHVVLRMLSERRLTLSTVEAGTGGLLAHRLTNVPGSEEWFRGSLVVPEIADCWHLMCPGQPHIDRRAKSVGQIATEAAAACRHSFGTEFALAIGEFARAETEPTGRPAASTVIALSGQSLSQSHEQPLLGDVSFAKSRAAKTALNLLRLHLLRNR